MPFILGKKIKMAQIFKEDGKIIPVTVVKAGPCFILEIKKKEKDGYNAVVVGFEKLSPKKVKKPQKDKPFRYIVEFRDKKITEKIEGYKKGDKIDLSLFKEGDKVKVSGISKGKGFAGVVKRWGFSGRGKTHGVKHEERQPGSIGSAWPQKVFKGKKMPGRMGSERITLKNLEIVKIDKKNNLMAIKGALPGGRGNLLEIYR